MSLRKKTFLLLALSFVALITLLSLSSRYIFTNKFEKIEHNLAHKNLVRAKLALKSQFRSLSSFLVDWSAWDDTYIFMKDHNTEYIKSNLGPESFEQQSISFMIYADSSNRVIWGKQYNPVTGRLETADPDIIENIPYYNLQVSHKKDIHDTDLIRVSDKLYAVAFHRVIRSDFSGEPRGIMVAGRVIDRKFTEKLIDRTAMDLELTTITSIKSLNPPEKKLIRKLRSSASYPDSFITEARGNDIQGYTFLADSSGEGGLLLKVSNQQLILANGKRAVRMNSIILMGIGLAFTLAIMILFERLFLSRISVLTEQVKKLGESREDNRELIKQIDRSTNDEISKLAGSIADAASELNENKAFLDTVVNTIDSGIMLVDPENGEIVLLNRNAEKMTGASVGENMKELCGSEMDYSSQICSFKDINDESIVTLRGVSQVKKNGKDLLLVTLTDISELLEAQKSLRLSERTYKTIFRNTGTASIMISDDMSIILANREFSNMAGISRKRIEGQMKWTEFFHPEDVERMKEYHRLRRKDESLAPRSYEARFIGGGQKIRYVQMTVGMMPDGINSIASMLDITAQKEAARKLSYQAFHDSLTGLPNRFLLMDRMSHSMTVAQRENKTVGVFMVDLDRFKIINDSMGHNHGDIVLKQVSQRLSAALRKRDTLARFGGDEFIVIIEDAENGSDLANIAEKLLESLSFPFMVDNTELYVQASIGIAVYPSDGDTPDTLIKNADLAMYRSKELGRNRYSLFTEEMDLITRRRVKVEHELRAAVSAGKIEVYFQPIIDMRTGGIARLEALARWKDSKGKMVSPADFIPVAEESGLIVELDRLVMTKACQMVNNINMLSEKPIQLSVNLSARHFDTNRLPEFILGTLDQLEFPRELMTIEITETCLMTNMETAIPMLSRIRDAGVEISLDDFGTGYSSLGYLQKLPISSLKIDRSFVSIITGKGGANMKLAQAIISLARNLSLQVVAEGVETRDQLAFLTKNDCEFAQGYLFSKPVPENELKDLLKLNFLEDQD